MNAEYKPRELSVAAFRDDPLRDTIWRAVRLRLYDSLLHSGANTVEIEGSLHNSTGMPPYVAKRLSESRLSSARAGAELESRLTVWLRDESDGSRRYLRTFAYFLGACIVAQRAGASLVFPLDVIQRHEMLTFIKESFPLEVSTALERTLAALQPTRVKGLIYEYESAIPFESVAEDIRDSAEFRRYARSYGLLRSDAADVSEVNQHISESAIFVPEEIQELLVAG